MWEENCTTTLPHCQPATVLSHCQATGSIVNKFERRWCGARGGMRSKPPVETTERFVLEFSDCHFHAQTRFCLFVGRLFPFPHSSWCRGQEAKLSPSLVNFRRESHHRLAKANSSAIRDTRYKHISRRSEPKKHNNGTTSFRISQDCKGTIVVRQGGDIKIYPLQQHKTTLDR